MQNKILESGNFKVSSELNVRLDNKHESFSECITMIQTHWNDLKNYLKDIKNEVIDYNKSLEPELFLKYWEKPKNISIKSMLIGLSLPIILQGILEIFRQSYDKYYILGSLLIGFILLGISCFIPKDKEKQSLKIIESHLSGIDRRIEEIESYNPI